MKPFTIFVWATILVICATAWWTKSSAFQLPPTTLNTNITASVSVLSVTSNSIMLHLEATSTDGQPITQFDIFRNGVWIDTVNIKQPVPPTRASIH